MKLICWLL